MYSTTQFRLTQCSDTVKFLTFALSLHVFSLSRIVHTCHTVPINPLLHCPPLPHVTWCRIVHPCKFHQPVFAGDIVQVDNEESRTTIGKCTKNNNDSPIYIAPYAELQRRWTTVNQEAVNRNVFKCFLKTESELQSRMFDGINPSTGAKKLYT